MQGGSFGVPFRPRGDWQHLVPRGRRHSAAGLHEEVSFVFVGGVGESVTAVAVLVLFFLFLFFFVKSKLFVS